MKDLPDGRYVIFEHGERVQGQPGTVNYVIEQFAEYAVRIESKESATVSASESISTDALWRVPTQKPDIAELQRRFSIPSGDHCC